MAYCPHCGAQLTDGAKFCSSCGSAVGTAQNTDQPTPPQPSYQEEFYQQKQQANANAQASQPRYNTSVGTDPKYQTLGGWLLFFVICWGLGALSGVSSIFTMLLGSYGAFGTHYLLPTLLNVLSTALSVGISVAMVVLIVQRNQSFLRLYQILSIANIAISAVVALVSGIAIAMSGVTGAVGSGGSVVGGAVGLFLMTMYFCKSVRVRTYMGSREYLDLALFKVGAE